MITDKQILQSLPDTEAYVVSEEAEKYTGNMFSKLFPGRAAVIVADRISFEIAGRKVHETLNEYGIKVEKPFIFDCPGFFAEWNFLEELEEYLRGVDAVTVAVGSGVINDLSKLSSEHLGRRYMTYGTAVSMDGYTSYGASVTYKGNKQTFDCRAPKGIIIDSAVAAGAPQPTIAAGYSDLFAKISSTADWRIADALGIEKIDEFVFGIVHQGLDKAIMNPESVGKKDVKTIGSIAEMLIKSGFAMQIYRSSRPSSGAEHLYSHCWDIENVKVNGRGTSHGFKVAIGSLVSLASLEFLLNYDMSEIDVDECVAQWPSWEEMEKDIRKRTSHNKGLLDRCLTEAKKKYIGKDELRKEIGLFLSVWPKLSKKIEKEVMPYCKAKQYLKIVGAPYEPEMLGVSREHLRRSFYIIPYMRKRYTNADTFQRLGLLRELDGFLFGKNGYFEIK